MKKKYIRIFLLIVFICSISLVGFIVLNNSGKQKMPTIAKLDNQESLQEFIIEQEIINISECSDELVNNYLEEAIELNKEISQEDEETQKEIKSNMLIVTSKEENINSYGATQTIKAPNNQYILVYENKEKMEQAKIDLDSDEKILDVDNNRVYELFEIDDTEDEELKANQDSSNTMQTTIQATYNSWGVTTMGLDVAKEVANSNSLEEVIVAIIDTGCNIELVESKYPNKIKGYYDVYGSSEFTDEEGHGTHIAGTIAEATPANVKIFPIKVTNSSIIFDSDIILAINYVAQNNIADVINMSFGGYHINESMYTAIAAADSKNIITVAAAGNENVSSNCYPASFDNTMSIAACTKTLEKASFSNYNNAITFTAPGEAVLSVNGLSSGTSMAAPHVSSAVAIYKSYNKNYTLENMIDVLKENCIDLGDEGKDKYFGYGLINLADIIYCECSCSTCYEIDCTGCECATCIENANNKTISKIEVVSPTVLTYNYGSFTNLSNIVVNIQYSDESTEQVNLLELEDCQITGYNPYTYGEQTITITYKEQTTSFTLNIAEEYELGWNYESNGEQTVKLTGLKTTSDMQNIILYIPETIDNYTVTELGAQLFYEQENLNKVILKDNVSTIGEYAFYNCTNLEYMKGTASTLYINKHAFDSCTSLSKAEISSQELYISDYAFNNCTSLESSIKGIKQLGEYAFYQCYKLETIELASEVTNIGKYAYAYTSITTMAIPEGIQTINEGTFYCCYSLGSVTLPTTLTSIGTKAFYNCTNILTLEIPAALTSISEDAFARCSVLRKITVDDANTIYDDRDSCNAIIETATNKLILGSSKTTIPETVKAIGANAFNDRIDLYVIDIPEGVTTIGENAFANCKFLLMVTLPNSVTSIETNSFSNTPYVILYVYKNSYSKTYAVENDIEYRHIDKEIAKISLDNYTSTIYKAFEKVSLDGVKVKIVYDDESEIEVTEGYQIEYETENDSFRYGDTSFAIYYNSNGEEFRQSFEVTVEKATPEYTIPTNLTAKTGQKLSDITLPDGFEWTDATVTIIEAGSKIYEAKFTPEDTVNYEIVENIEITVEVAKAIPTEITEVGGITIAGYVAYETVQEENMYIKVLYDTGVIEEKTEGYKIKYETGNDSFRYGETKYIIEYTEDETTIQKEVEVTVGKATPEYTIPTDITAKIGQKLSDITLPDGFEWMDSNITLNELGIKTYKARFVPVDTINYITVEDIEITVEVTKGTPTEITEVGGVTITEYTAFETVQEENMYIKVLYDTGINAEITEGYQIKYETGNDSFRYGETKYIVEYTEDEITLEKEVEVTVSKATPEYTVPTNIIAKTGQTLSNIELPEGFEWMDSSIKITEVGTKIYKAKFIPEDTVNYATVENIEITVEVSKGVVDLTSKEYVITDAYISRINPDTSLETFKANMNVETIRIYKDSSKAKEVTSDTVATNMYMEYEENTRTLSVIGDLNNDGKANQLDLSLLIRHILGFKDGQITDDMKILSADITGDNSINNVDITALIRYNIFGEFYITASAPEITNITADTAKDSIKITVTADNAENGIYQYLYKADGESDYTEAAKTKENTYTITGLKENTQYTVMVKITNKYGMTDTEEKIVTTGKK